MKRKLFQLAVVSPTVLLFAAALLHLVPDWTLALAAGVTVCIIGADIRHKDYGRGYGYFEDPPDAP